MKRIGPLLVVNLARTTNDASRDRHAPHHLVQIR
jgi:hypothetical protein